MIFFLGYGTKINALEFLRMVNALNLKKYICVRVLYTKQKKFETKKTYGQDKILPQPKQIYTGMPVMPVTNSRYAPPLGRP